MKEYKELFKLLYLNENKNECLNIYELASKCKQELRREWIEEDDMLFFKENAFVLEINDIIENMPKLDWWKIALETLQRKSGACCHFAAYFSAVATVYSYKNCIAIGSCMLTKGKYRGMRGLHYWNRIYFQDKIINIDLNSDNPILSNDEIELQNILYYKEIDI